jgi:hypothetical protein
MKTMAVQCAVREPELRDHGGAVRGSRTDSTESWCCTATVHEPGYGNHGGERKYEV